MTNETKNALFNKMLELETLADEQTHSQQNYFDRAETAFEMLKILGLEHEYIEWSFGRTYEG